MVLGVDIVVRLERREVPGGLVAENAGVTSQRLGRGITDEAAGLLRLEGHPHAEWL